MTNIYKDNFAAIKTAFPSVFEALERGCKKLDIDFFLIGAQSRNVWINHLDLPARTTNDVDYCIYTHNVESWKQLNQYLIGEEGFYRDRELPYRFYKAGEIIDLLPFGGMERNGEVILEDPLMELSVIGFKEVTEDAVIIEGKYRVITLPGCCILKLVAYSEQPDRVKDFDDFLFLTNNYDIITGDELFTGNYDDLFDEDFELKPAAARMLGRHMAPILNKNSSLKERVTDELQRKLRKFSEDDINEMYEVDRNDEKILNFKLILEVIKGIHDGL